MHTTPPTIHTERLILRPFTLKDVHASFKMNLDPDVSRYTGDGGVVSKEEIERRIREHVLGDYDTHGYGRLAVELNNSPGFIGFCGLKYLPDINEVDLGYRFMQEYWGKGIATEAGNACLEYGFSTLRLSRVIATVLPANIASIMVLKKLGFEFETRTEEDGETVHQYSITKS